MKITSDDLEYPKSPTDEECASTSMRRSSEEEYIPAVVDNVSTLNTK